MPGRADGECKGLEVKKKKKKTHKCVWETARYPEGLLTGNLEVRGKRESERNIGGRS